MTSLLNRMRSSAGPVGQASTTSPSKKDSNSTLQTPLEKHVQSDGPLQEDGSDKFWGLENFGNTCYANSILQSLYHSEPFREHVINYPNRTPYNSVINSPTGQQRMHPNTTSLPLNHPSLTYAKLMNRSNVQNNASARNPAGPPAVQKPEDKEHPDYKKRVAQARGPSLAMTYDNATAYDMPESLFTSLKDIFEAILFHQSHTGVVSPSRFLEILRRDNEMYRSAMHQDAHEFLNLLLNDVMENVEGHGKKVIDGKSPPTQDSKGGLEHKQIQAMPETATPSRWIHDLFEGLLTSETKCLTCENVSQRDEVFLDLSVDLEEHASVTSCLRKFSEEEMLCERNKFHCDNCGGLQEAEKRMKIKRLPKILALHLKRFKFTDDFTRLQKLFHRVVYPYHLRLFNTTDDAPDPDRLYELYAVVVHIGGGPYHGHYVAIIKTKDRGWLLFDDELVEPVDKSFVQNFFGDRPGLACAYVLFYQETTMEAVRREEEVERQKLAPKAVVAPVKENGFLGPKANGFLGSLTHVKSAMTISSHDDTPLVLDKVLSDPLPGAEVQPVGMGDLTALPAMPNTAASAEDAKAKKIRLKEDKERKAAARSQAKEEEKAEKEKRKTLDLIRRDKAKKQDSEVELAHANGKINHQEEEQRKPIAENGPEVINGGIGGLSRFRNTSKSFRKPKFFGNSSREMSKDEPQAELSDRPPTNASQIGPESIGKLQERPPDKTKHRFSALRKKTSSLML